MPNIGPLELIIVLVVVLLLFGAKRLPELGRSLGSGMKEFKDGVTGKDSGPDAPAKAELDSGEPQAAQPIPQEPAETPVEAEPRT